MGLLAEFMGEFVTKLQNPGFVLAALGLLFWAVIGPYITRWWLLPIMDAAGGLSVLGLLTASGWTQIFAS